MFGCNGSYGQLINYSVRVVLCNCRSCGLSQVIAVRRRSCRLGRGSATAACCRGPQLESSVKATSCRADFSPVSNGKAQELRRSLLCSGLVTGRVRVVLCNCRSCGLSQVIIVRRRSCRLRRGSATAACCMGPQLESSVKATSCRVDFSPVSNGKVQELRRSLLCSGLVTGRSFRR